MREEDLNAFIRPEGAPGEITPEELLARVLAPPSREEIQRRRKIFAEVTRLRDRSKPLGTSSAALIRIARRADELAYGLKTWDEVLAEES